jgi:ADP-ribose pyrophosphatase YjhB (NUDIX family)
MIFIWHKAANFDHLDPITQVYGVCFNKDGDILIKKGLSGEWNIPGGSPELNEMPVQTLKRELGEETDVEIGKCQMIGYFEVPKDNSVIYQLRYACIIKGINKQTVDPAERVINERKFVRPDDFFKYVMYENYRPMIAEAIKWFAKR